MSQNHLTQHAFWPLLAVISGLVLVSSLASGSWNISAQQRQDDEVTRWRRPVQTRFVMEVLVDGQRLREYYTRGRTYVEALRGAEYTLRLHNRSSDRIAVALSVDGLNTIDARRTSPWNSSKWVIEPYQTITISGWQMSTERARRFYFTNERDSYASRLGQPANFGVIAAVVFRERRRIISISPPRDDRGRRQRDEAPESAGNGSSTESARGDRKSVARISDDNAATGIGRSVRNEVRWVDLELDSQPAARVSIQYEYYQTLRKLGVLPGPYDSSYPNRRREDSQGFSPEP